MRGWKEIHEKARHATPGEMEAFVDQVLKEKNCSDCLAHWKRYKSKHPIRRAKCMPQYISAFHRAVDKVKKPAPEHDDPWKAAQGVRTEFTWL
jgi:hypothetical protein